MIGLIIVIFLCSLIGLVIFAKYYDCDPVSAVSPLGLNVRTSENHFKTIASNVVGCKFFGSVTATIRNGCLRKISWCTWASTRRTYFG